MSETVRQMLVRGTAAAQAGSLVEARRYLEHAADYPDGTHAQKAQAHLWLSRITEDTAAQREHLEAVLSYNPTHSEAIRALAILDGRLDPDEIIDPDALDREAPGAAPVAPSPKAETVQARRVVCPQCGGHMHFDPTAASVTCRYCDHRLPMLAALKLHSPVEEQDFVVALATAKGHQVPDGVRAFRCQGCQATLLAARALSTRCPYCGSAHIVAVTSQAIVEPEGLIPFAVDAAAATRAFHAWLKGKCHSRDLRTTRVRGLYLPLWTFDLMGEVRWRGTERERSGRAGVVLSEGGLQWHAGSGQPAGERVREGTHYVMMDDIIVAASHNVPYAISEIFESFDLAGVVPYDAAYLTDWPANLYDVAVSDASLVARRRALEKATLGARARADATAPGLRDFQVVPTGLAVQAYKLLLVPIWLANYRCDDAAYTVVVNGQTGKVVGEEPPGTLRKLVSRLLS